MGQVHTVTYSIEEVAKLLRISRTTAYEAAKSGQIPTIRIGKRLLVPTAALEQLLQGRATRPAEGALPG